MTVIVPTRNERPRVAAFVASLPADVDLLVVDASDDGTPEAFLRLRPHRTVVLRSPERIARARHLGAEAAATDWLLFTDADVAFVPGYFVVLAERVAHTTADVLYGPKHATRRHPRYGQLFAAAQRLLHRVGIPSASGSNLAVRRSAYRAVGGFRPDLLVNEDTELAMRLGHRGHRLEWVDALGVASTDDRRLDRGIVRKTVHSTVRSALLWLGLRVRLPERWLAGDWGYWDAA